MREIIRYSSPHPNIEFKVRTGLFYRQKYNKIWPTQICVQVHRIKKKKKTEHPWTRIILGWTDQCSIWGAETRKFFYILRNVTFSLKSETCPAVTLNGRHIPQEETAKYLGLHLERRLTWQKHIFTKRKQTAWLEISQNVLVHGKEVWTVSRK